MNGKCKGYKEEENAEKNARATKRKPDGNADLALAKERRKEKRLGK